MRDRPQKRWRLLHHLLHQWNLLLLKFSAEPNVRANQKTFAISSVPHFPVRNTKRSKASMDLFQKSVDQVIVDGVIHHKKKYFSRRHNSNTWLLEETLIPIRFNQWPHNPFLIFTDIISYTTSINKEGVKGRLTKMQVQSCHNSCLARGWSHSTARETSMRFKCPWKNSQTNSIYAL